MEPLDDRERAVVVAMTAVGMMQMAADDIVGMVVVRDRFMATGSSVPVAARVVGARMPGRARRRVLFSRFERALVDVVAMRFVQVPVMKVIDVVAVLERLVPA